MATENKVMVNGHGGKAESNGEGTNFTVKAGLAQMLKGGVIMDVVNVEQVTYIHTQSTVCLLLNCFANEISTI